jgi:hypothetical protein
MLRRAAWLASLVGALAFAAPALAGSKSSSIDLVVLSSGTSALTAEPSYGQTVTFEVHTTATDKPSVQARCYQDGVWVYSHTGFFYGGDSPSQYFTLASSAWTGGAADCTAELYYVNKKGASVTLATLLFHVNA